MIYGGGEQVFYLALTVFPIQDITAVSASSGVESDFLSLENAKNSDLGERLQYHSGMYILLFRIVVLGLLSKE